MENADTNSEKTIESARWVTNHLYVTQEFAFEHRVVEDVFHFGSSFMKYLGFEEKQTDYRTKQSLDVVHPEDVERCWIAYQEFLNGERKSLTQDARLRHRNGEWFWFRIRVVARERDAAGRVLVVKGTCSDINEEKRIQGAVRETEEKYRAIVENQIDYMVKVSANYIFEFVSPSLCELMGRPEGDVIGQSPREFFHPDDLPLVEKSIETAARDPHRVVETVRLRTRLGWRWIEWHVKGILDQGDRLLFYVATGRDISERRRVEDALKESERRFQEALRCSNSMLYCFDCRKDQYEYLSESVETQTGHTLEEFKRVSFAEMMTLWHPEDRERIMPEIEAMRLKTGPEGRFTLHMEYRRKLADGEFHWLSDRTTIILDERGEFEKFIGSVDIIDERKKMEQALLESERRFQEALAISNSVFYCFDCRKDTYEYISDSLLRQTGYTVEDAKTTPLMVSLSNWHPEDRARLLPLIEEKRLQAGPNGRFTMNMEYRRKLKDDQYHWMSDRATIILDEKGEMLRFIGSFDIVDERKNAEQALRDSETLFRSLVDILPVPVLMVQGERVVFTNQATLGVLGYTEDEILKGKFWDFFHPESRELYKNQALARLRGETVARTYVCPFIAKSGEKKYLEISATMIDFKGKPTSLACMPDMTRRLMAEQEAREKERLLNTTIDAIQDGITVLDRDLNVLRINKTSQSWYAFNAPLVGKKCYEAFHKKSKPCVDCPTVEAMKRGKACVNIVPKLSVDGKSHGWIELHAYPIRDVEGNVCGVVEHARDITERRKEERRLARQTRRLEVMEKVARLLHTRREAGLREVLETLGDYFEADMVRAWNLSDDLSQMFLREAWSRSSDMIRVPELGAAYPVPSKWSTDQFAANRVILVKNVEDIPSSAGFERNWARKFNIKAYIAVPFRQGAGPLLGFVTLVTTEHSPNWGREELDIAKGIASILASHYALDREEARLRQELLLRKEKERLLRIELRARRRESEAMVGGIADILAHGTRLIEGVAGAEPASASASTVRRLAAFHRLARAAARVADPNPEPIDLRLRLREIVEAIPERAVLALADKESRADAEPWTYDGPAEWIDEMVPLLVEMLHELGRGAPTRVSAKAVRRGAKLASLTLGFSVPCAKTGVSADRLLELIEKSQTAVADVADASAGEWSNFVFEYRILRSLVQLARGRLEPRLYPDNHIGFAHEVPGISQVVYSEQSENDLRPNK